MSWRMSATGRPVSCGHAWGGESGVDVVRAGRSLGLMTTARRGKWPYSTRQRASQTNSVARGHERRET